MSFETAVQEVQALKKMLEGGDLDGCAAKLSELKVRPPLHPLHPSRPFVGLTLPRALPARAAAGAHAVLVHGDGGHTEPQGVYARASVPAPAPPPTHSPTPLPPSGASPF